MRKLDARIVRTRQALADALITLALERGYENLTIKAVTDYAGVGYNTFYRHYQSLDNLLIHILTAGLQKINELAIQFDTPHGETVAMYTYIKEHPDVMRVYINLPCVSIRRASASWPSKRKSCTPATPRRKRPTYRWKCRSINSCRPPTTWSLGTWTTLMSTRPSKRRSCTKISSPMRSST